MAKAIELPLVKPLYSTYHIQGISSAIIQSNPSIKNYFYHSAFNLKCRRNFLAGYTSPEIGIVCSGYSVNPHLEKLKIPMWCAKGYLPFLIRSLIDNGYYVVFNGVDDYYMKGKSWYQEKHFSHDGLIVGYDQGDKTYTIYAYDQNWQYCTFKIPQACFEEGRNAIKKENPNGFIMGVKPLPDKVELQPLRVVQKIYEYLDSSREKYPLDLEKASLEEKPLAYGIVVQDYICLYLDKLLDESIPHDRMDRRVFRLIWEHKAVMLERIRACEEHLQLGDDFGNAYAPLVKKADNMRMMYALYNQRRRDSLLLSIKQGLQEIRMAETTMLREFAHKIEEAGK